MTVRPRGILGIRTADGEIVQIFDFRTGGQSKTVFTTVKDGQGKAVFDLYYQREGSYDWHYLDSLALNGIPPGRAGDPELTVTARLDPHEKLSIELDDLHLAEPQAFILKSRILGDILWPPESQGDATPSSLTNPVATSHSGPSKEKRGRGVAWLIVAVLGLSVVVCLLIFGLSPVQLGRNTGEGAVRQVESKSPAKTALTEPPRDRSTTEPSVTAEVSDSIAASNPQETVSDGVSDGRRKDAQSDPRQQQWGASDVTLDGGGDEKYRILWGDTLWRITERYYGDRKMYPALADANRIADPDLIIAGEALFLPPLLENKRRSDFESGH
jgi:hypothetical protein